MANARSSESRQVNDIQAMLSGCENVPKVCVHTTPKYRTPRRLISVKIRLKTYPNKWKLIPAITVCPRALLFRRDEFRRPCSDTHQPNSQLVGYVAEPKRHGDLEEQTHGCQRITRQGSEPKAVDDRGRIRVESSLRSVVAESDQKVNPKPPVAELQSMKCCQRSATIRLVLLLTAFLNDDRPMCFFFLPFMGSSMTTRDFKMCSSLSVKKLVLGKKVLLGFLKESGRKKPRIAPLAIVNAPIKANNQNQPGLPPTPRMCRIP
jgi:hypothetical protein